LFLLFLFWKEQIEMEQTKAVNIQRPGEIIKPIIPDDVVPELVKKLYGLDVISCEELDSYDDKNYHVIVSDQSNNPNIKEVFKGGYIFKILNKMDSKKPLKIGLYYFHLIVSIS